MPAPPASPEPPLYPDLLSFPASENVFHVSQSDSLEEAVDIAPSLHDGGMLRNINESGELELAVFMRSGTRDNWKRRSLLEYMRLLVEDADRHWSRVEDYGHGHDPLGRSLIASSNLALALEIGLKMLIDPPVPPRHNLEELASLTPMQSRGPGSSDFQKHWNRAMKDGKDVYRDSRYYLSDMRAISVPIRSMRLCAGILLGYHEQQDLLD